MNRYKNTVRTSRDGQFFDEIKEDPNGEIVYLEDVRQLARECKRGMDGYLRPDEWQALQSKLLTIIGEATATETFSCPLVGCTRQGEHSHIGDKFGDSSADPYANAPLTGPGSRLQADLDKMTAKKTEPVMPKHQCCFCTQKFLTTEVRDHHEETCKADHS